MEGLKRAKLLTDRKRPKIPYAELKKIIESSGIKITNKDYEFGIVVGGDGLFSLYGRTEDIPLLFVGVRSSSLTESKAYLAATYVEEIKQTSKSLLDGNYTVSNLSRLDVMVRNRKVGSIFTDVYVQRGAESNCIRYRLSVRNDSSGFNEYGISDGVVVCTRAGSTGYFSYIDKIKSGYSVESENHTLIDEREIGICHIVPTYTEREGQGIHPLRYTVPIDSRIRIEILRDADARLYGVSGRRSGIKLGKNDFVEIRKSKDFTRIIKLGPMRPPV